MFNKLGFPAGNSSANHGSGHHSSEVVTRHDPTNHTERTNRVSAPPVSENRRTAEEHWKSAFNFLESVNGKISKEDFLPCQKIVADYAKHFDDVKFIPQDDVKSIPQAIFFFRRLVFLPLGFLQEMLNQFKVSSLSFVKLGNHLANEGFHWLLSYPVDDNERATSSGQPALHFNGPTLETNARTFLEWLIDQALQSHADSPYIVTLLKFSCELKSERYTEALEKRLSNQLHNLTLESLQALKEQTALSIIDRFRSGSSSPSKETSSARSLADSYLLYCGVRHSDEWKALQGPGRNDAIRSFLDHHPEERNSGTQLHEYGDPSNAKNVGTKGGGSSMPNSISSLAPPQVPLKSDEVIASELKKTREELKKTIEELKKIREESKMEHHHVRELDIQLHQARYTIQELKKNQFTAKERISELENDVQALETERAKLKEADSGSYRVDGPAPAHLTTALSDFRKVVSIFIQRLSKLFEQKGVDSNKIVSQTLNHIVKQDRTGLKHVLTSQVVDLIFVNFENEQFQAGGETSIDVISRCNDRFKESSCLTSDMEKNPKFQAFCGEKWTLLQRSFMNSGNGRVYDISSVMDVLFSDFLKVSLSAWKIHRLAFSFNPPASIIRVKENIRVDDIQVTLIRAFDDDWTEEEKKNAISAFMIFPGFRIRSNVIPCQVYPKVPSSRKVILETDVSTL